MAVGVTLKTSFQLFSSLKYLSTQKKKHYLYTAADKQQPSLMADTLESKISRQ